MNGKTILKRYILLFLLSVLLVVVIVNDNPFHRAIAVALLVFIELWRDVEVFREKLLVREKKASSVTLLARRPASSPQKPQ